MHSQLVPRGSPLSISLPIPGGNITSMKRKELLLQSFEPQSLPTQPSTCQKPDTPQSHNALKCNVLIVAAFLFAEFTLSSVTNNYSNRFSVHATSLVHNKRYTDELLRLCTDSSRIRKWIDILSCYWGFICHVFL